MLEETPYEIGREVGMGLDTIPNALETLNVSYSDRKVVVTPTLVGPPRAQDLYWADAEGNYIADFSSEDLGEFERGIRDWLREWREAMVLGRFGKQIWPETTGNPEKYLTILDPGQTTFKEGEVVSPEAYEKENKRVQSLSLRTAYGKHIGDLAKTESNPTVIPEPTGACYEDAWRFLIREEEGELVHGSVQTIGKRINHAWVELPTGFVWEPESGEFMKKSSFYERAEPQVEARYTTEEAAIMAARTKTFGPWTDIERAEFLKEKQSV